MALECPRCGSENGDGARFCYRCGGLLYRIADEPAVTRPLRHQYDGRRDTISRYELLLATFMILTWLVAVFMNWWVNSVYESQDRQLGIFFTGIVSMAFSGALIGFGIALLWAHRSRKSAESGAKTGEELHVKSFFSEARSSIFSPSISRIQIDVEEPSARISSATSALLYIMSFFIPPLGYVVFLVTLLYLSGRDYLRVGRNCAKVGVVSLLFFTMLLVLLFALPP